MIISRPVLAHETIEAINGMVVAQHHIASEIGLDVLKRGGNAVDAAVTTALAVGVLLPFKSGIGGGGVVILRRSEGSSEVIDYGMQGAAANSPYMFDLLDDHEPPSEGTHRYSRRYSSPLVRDDANIKGYKSISTPGTVAGLSLALERWGTIDLADAIAPAVDLAETGFRVGLDFTLALVNGRDYLHAIPASRALYYPDGYPIEPGSTFVQKDYAHTLRQIASKGADAFYRGEIAQMICGDIEDNGGTLRIADFAEYKPIFHNDALNGSYRGFGILAVPGPTAGPTVLEILNILENFETSSRRFGSADLLHLIIEATKLAGVDRFTYMGDPDITGAPIDALSVKAYGRERAAELVEQGGASYPEPGNPWPYSGKNRPLHFPGPAGVAQDSGTTHLTVVDRDRNAVSLTQTNVGYSGVVNPGVGVMMNNAMRWPDPMPGTINSIAPRARSLHNMTPLILHRDGRLVAALGASGGRRIWTALTQAIVNHIDFDMPLKAAIEAPRMHAESDNVLLDRRFPDAVKVELERLGHRIELTSPSNDTFPFSTPNGISNGEPRSAGKRRSLKSAVSPSMTSAAAGY